VNFIIVIGNVKLLDVRKSTMDVLQNH